MFDFKKQQQINIRNKITHYASQAIKNHIKCQGICTHIIGTV